MPGADFRGTTTTHAPPVAARRLICARAADVSPRKPRFERQLPQERRQALIAATIESLKRYADPKYQFSAQIGGLYSDVTALDDYTVRYQLNAERCATLPAHAVIMHPGPYNRGIELTDDALADPRSRYVQQVNNGVFVRMAVLDLLAGKNAA